MKFNEIEPLGGFLLNEARNKQSRCNEKDGRSSEKLLLFHSTPKLILFTAFPSQLYFTMYLCQWLALHGLDQLP
jgi:hypothetical protein